VRIQTHMINYIKSCHQRKYIILNNCNYICAILNEPGTNWQTF